MNKAGLGRRIEGSIESLSGLVPALVFGFLMCALLAVLAGVAPVDLATTVWTGAWGSPDAAATTLSKTTPLLLTGLAVSLAYQTNLLNIGCEGQLTLGALASSAFAVAAAPLPGLVLIPLTMLVGAGAGAAWAYPAVWLKQQRGVHEVISTLLMNYMAIYLCEYLVLGPLGDGTAMGRTPEIPTGAVWPFLWRHGAVGVTAAPFLALLLCIGVHLWLSRTCWGYEIRAVGSSTTSSRAAGIPVDRWQTRLFVLSGALAGLAGALEVATVHHRFYRTFSPGYGFDGITAAFVVNASPGWLWLSGLFLASLRAADKWLQLSLQVTPNAIVIIQAVLLISVACQARFRSAWQFMLTRFKEVRSGYR
ncbi:MAG: ABC transporter permease [Syntrophobacteraceae bacterium]|nr:ABC transporter permease [Syntrophobacteraceae bacterium]